MLYICNHNAGRRCESVVTMPSQGSVAVIFRVRRMDRGIGIRTESALEQGVRSMLFINHYTEYHEDKKKRMAALSSSFVVAGTACFGKEED